MYPTEESVVPVAVARSGLSATLRSFRDDPDAAPVIIGSHRKPEAVLVPVAAYRRMVAAREGVTLERVRELASVITKLARASSLSDVRVFGSVARGDSTSDSDLDLLVAASDTATLFDVAQFEIDVEAVLGWPVTAVPITALRDGDAAILEQSIPL